MDSVPSVTRVLTEVGLAPSFDGFAAERVSLKAKLGLAVDHTPKAGVNLEKWRIPEGPAGDYARSLREWFRTSGATVLSAQAEYTGVVDGYRYVTHPDLELDWQSIFWTMEVKCTSELVPAYGVQLAAQVMASPLALKACRGNLAQARRGVLWVGPSRVKLVSGPRTVCLTDFESWRSAVQLWQAGFRCCLRA